LNLILDAVVSVVVTSKVHADTKELHQDVAVDGVFPRVVYLNLSEVSNQ
jgi:hypothetical protein